MIDLLRAGVNTECLLPLIADTNTLSPIVCLVTHCTGELTPHHMEVFKGNTYFRGLHIPVPETTVSLMVYSVTLKG